jgi:stage V sporulation protein R
MEADSVASQRLPSPSDWTVELIETYFEAIRTTAARFKLDTYPVQLELISAEQMLDAYASVGMPVNYRHWSYGKQFILNEKSYRRGQMGLAYEIVINSDPCIAYLMEENTLPMQALVMAHACFGRGGRDSGRLPRADELRRRPLPPAAEAVAGGGTGAAH